MFKPEQPRTARWSWDQKFPYAVNCNGFETSVPQRRLLLRPRFAELRSVPNLELILDNLVFRFRVGPFHFIAVIAIWRIRRRKPTKQTNFYQCSTRLAILSLLAVKCAPSELLPYPLRRIKTTCVIRINLF